MKCEICNNAEAVKVLKGRGEDDERYVCEACAAKVEESQEREEHEDEGFGFPREGDGPAEGDEAMRKMIDAVGGILDTVKDTIARHAGKGFEFDDAAFEELKPGKSMLECMMNGFLHLEGLFLMGDLDKVKHAMETLDMRLEHPFDRGHDSGHLYRVMYAKDLKDAKKAWAAMQDLVDQERYARIALVEEDPLVFADTLARSISVLRSARLLAAGEYVDLLSPLKLASHEGFLDGITEREIDSIVRRQAKIAAATDHDPYDEDAERADNANARFAKVRLNERARRIFG